MLKVRPPVTTIRFIMHMRVDAVMGIPDDNSQVVIGTNESLYVPTASLLINHKSYPSIDYGMTSPPFSG